MLAVVAVVAVVAVGVGRVGVGRVGVGRVGEVGVGEDLGASQFLQEVREAKLAKLQDGHGQSPARGS